MQQQLQQNPDADIPGYDGKNIPNAKAKAIIETLQADNADVAAKLDTLLASQEKDMLRVRESIDNSSRADLGLDDTQQLQDLLQAKIEAFAQEKTRLKDINKQLLPQRYADKQRLKE